VWVTQPREVNEWWRQRAQMKLFWDHDHWTVVGPGSERASVAYFKWEDDKPRYAIEDRSHETIPARGNGHGMRMPMR